MAQQAFSGPPNSTEFDKLDQQTKLDIRSTLTPLLSKYCPNACEIIDIDVGIEQSVPEAEDRKSVV